MEGQQQKNPDKSRLISRMAKMGQALFPVSAQTPPSPRAEAEVASDSEVSITSCRLIGARFCGKGRFRSSQQLKFDRERGSYLPIHVLIGFTCVYFSVHRNRRID